MPISDRIGPHLPALRRYARALTGTQSSGDAYVAATLETILIDPSTMPLTRIANSAIDRVSREMEPVRAEIVKYAGSDLTCYRGEGPASLVAAQEVAWGPVLVWARESLGARFVLAAEVTDKLEHPGIVPVYDLGSGPDGRPYYAMR